MPTEISVTTPGLLFSTVSLIMLAYTNRFQATTHLIRSLSNDYSEKSDSGLLRQIQLLRRRAVLIKGIQILCILALLLSMVSMLLVLYAPQQIARSVFSISLLLMVGSLLISIYELTLSTDALNLSIPDVKATKKPERRDDREQAPRKEVHQIYEEVNQ